MAMPIIEGVVGRAIGVSGAPVAGTNEVQTLTIGGTPTAGTFQLGLEGRNTAAITWSNVNATLLSAMNTALDAAFGTASVVATAGTLTAGIGTILLTFGAAYARRAVPNMTTVSALTGTAPTLAVAETTPGVDATYRGAATGSMIIRTDTGQLYTNTSTTAGAPTWTVQA
jgi:hypothetical protein